MKVHMSKNRLSREPAEENLGGSLKRPYQKPALVEWGSIADLTKGLRNGFQDLPLGGGSESE